MSTEVKRATAARKTFFSDRSLERQQHDDFDVEIAKHWLPVGDEAGEVSNCFVWQAGLDDEGFKCGTPKSDDHAERAANLVLKHLNKTNHEPTL
jgi:hypothetical protein